MKKWILPLVVLLGAILYVVIPKEDEKFVEVEIPQNVNKNSALPQKFSLPPTVRNLPVKLVKKSGVDYKKLASTDYNQLKLGSNLNPERVQEMITPYFYASEPVLHLTNLKCPKGYVFNKKESSDDNVSVQVCDNQTKFDDEIKIWVRDTYFDYLIRNHQIFINEHEVVSYRYDAKGFIKKISFNFPLSYKPCIEFFLVPRGIKGMVNHDPGMRKFRAILASKKFKKNKKLSEAWNDAVFDIAKTIRSNVHYLSEFDDLRAAKAMMDLEHNGSCLDF
jgi:hypothetical protein